MAASIKARDLAEVLGLKKSEERYLPTFHRFAVALYLWVESGRPKKGSLANAKDEALMEVRALPLPEKRKEEILTRISKIVVKRGAKV